MSVVRLTFPVYPEVACAAAFKTEFFQTIPRIQISCQRKCLTSIRSAPETDYSGEPVSRKAASLRLAKLQELFGYIKKEISDDKF